MSESYSNLVHLVREINICWNEARKRLLAIQQQGDAGKTEVAEKYMMIIDDMRDKTVGVELWLEKSLDRARDAQSEMVVRNRHNPE